MIIATDYKVLRHDNCYYIANNSAPLCPQCQCALKVRDSRKRILITDSGERLTFRLRRLRCPECGSVHLELPDIMQRNKHYAKEVIKKTVEGTQDDCPADDSTIYRWKHISS